MARHDVEQALNQIHTRGIDTLLICVDSAAHRLTVRADYTPFIALTR
jgi:hypothetical protein